jgi:hypothetical protein
MPDFPMYQLDKGATLFIGYPVSTRVNSPKNDVPELIEAVGA